MNNQNPKQNPNQKPQSIQLLEQKHPKEIKAKQVNEIKAKQVNETKPETNAKTQPETKTRIALIRICGKSGIKKPIKDTLKMLRLYKKFSCTVIPGTKPYIGMIQKLDNYITWGEINLETLKALLEKRGRLPGKKPLTEFYIKEKINSTFEQFARDVFDFKKEITDIPGLKSFFKLTPPKFGFERKGTKMPFSLGGTCGYRKDKINELIKRMI